MKDYKISLAGDLGSGKTTVGRLISKKYGLEKVSIGNFLRDLATSYDMDVNEFNVYMEAHPEIDNLLDDKLKEYENKHGKFLFDSRLAWHFVPSSFSVYLQTSPEVAAERILYAGRESEVYGNIKQAVASIKNRRASEVLRYKTLYGVDITEMSNYDIVINSENKSPDEVFNLICQAFEKWLDE